MQTRKTVALALLTLLIVPALVLAAPRAGGGNPDEILRNPRLLARYLKLDEAQVAQLRTFSGELKTSLDAIRTARKPLEQNLQTLLNATSKDPCAIGNAVLALHANTDQAKAAVETFDDKFSAILTADQLARYEALKAAAHALGGSDLTS